MGKSLQVEWVRAVDGSALNLEEAQLTPLMSGWKSMEDLGSSCSSSERGERDGFPLHLPHPGQVPREIVDSEGIKDRFGL